jgi:hypothetical protein
MHDAAVVKNVIWVCSAAPQAGTQCHQEVVLQRSSVVRSVAKKEGHKIIYGRVLDYLPNTREDVCTFAQYSCVYICQGCVA